MVVAAAQAPTDEQRAAAKPDASDKAQGAALKLSPADMTWWEDAKIGLFVHWGLYAIPGQGEWYMHNADVPADVYARLADQFRPRHFDPDGWARLAKRAGARYMVMTARHHDGFALFNNPSDVDNFDSVHAAAHTDFIAAYVKAARREGLRVGIYYSLVNWRFPAYFHPKEMPENAALFKRQAYEQIEGLMRDYGRIDVLWYDGGWLALKGTDADAAWFWQPEKLNAMVRRYQPKVVINARSGWQGDFASEEGAAPITGPIRPEPWEKTFSLNTKAWGYTKIRKLVPYDTLITLLVNAVVRGGNMLVNVGPDPDGVIPAGQVVLLKRMGDWLKKNGESIYGTRPGPFAPVDGVYGSTQKGRFIYLHVLSWPQDTLSLPAPARKVVRATVLGGADVPIEQTGEAMRLAVPAHDRDPIDTIIRLELGDETRP
ncbi:MAG: alpha-L-fucosidase [Alphaproteobacteria bacterium]|nr:alpha-L-fucosidase [Alphaproteobacteria bacterium]